MSYLAGRLVMTVEAGAPNNGRGEGTIAPVKKARIHNQMYPYVSAQAFRRWVRDTITESGSVPSPVERVGKAQGKAQKATTKADPIAFADDDLFGFMKATAKSDDAATTVRDSPFMMGTLLAVEPTRPVSDFGVMSRGIPEPVLHEHEFYTAELSAPFLLDVARVGVFTFPDASKAGRPNYLDEKQAMLFANAASLGAETVTFRGYPAVRLPIEVRRDRVAMLIEALAAVTGGAKRALHYGDRLPSLVMMLAMRGGVNPLGRIIAPGELEPGIRVRGDVLGQELDAWDGEWQRPVVVGWAPGFLDSQRKQFEADLAERFATGEVVVDHPRTALRALAAAIRQGEHDAWFEDSPR